MTGIREFKPVFVVGHPRSGTTMLASILGKHSNISMPPETMFFFGIYNDSIRENGFEPLLQLALKNHRIRDLNLSPDSLRCEFEKLDPSMKSLFQSILETYRKKTNKSRPGEKTPLHLLWVPTILEWYPNAKIICVVRDGRDVVNSLLNTPWAKASIYRHCFDWRENYFRALNYRASYPSSFLLVKYEEILNRPEKEVRMICEFIEEEFELPMLEGGESDAVPAWEYGWKNKSFNPPDKSNVGKWRNLPANQQFTLNVLMKDTLQLAGYEPEMLGISRKVIVWIKAIWYHPLIRPTMSWIKWKVLKVLGMK